MRRILIFCGLLTLVFGEFVATGPAAHAAPPYGTDKWALLIGIDHFQGRTRSNVGSVGDANDAYNILINMGWPQDHIRLLTDGAATQANIRDGLNWLVANSGPNSFSVFHYSGHVKQISHDPDGDGEAVDEFLWPTDNKFISDGELSNSLRALQGWAWIDLSGCESAGLADSGVASAHRIVTASSQENEKSYEESDWHNSVFSGFMLDKGWLGGQANSDGDNVVNLQEAWNYAARNAPSYTANQKQGPQHPYMMGGDDTTWFLNPPPPPPPPPPPKKAKKCKVPRFISAIPCL